MSTKLLLLADLGHFKAYRIEESRQFSRPRLELLEELATHVTHHLTEDVTDRAGQVRKGSFAAGPSETSDGEEHNLNLERRHRAQKALANFISKLVTREEPEVCYFAAGKEINEAILSSLPRVIRTKIQKNVRLNLTKLRSDQILDHFYPKKGPATAMTRTEEPEPAPARRLRRNRAQNRPRTAPGSKFSSGAQSRSSSETAAGQIISSSQPGAFAAPPKGKTSTWRLNRSNVRRKPAARRTSPFKKLMRKQTINSQVSRAMRQVPEKGDRRRTLAQHRIRKSIEQNTSLAE